MGDFDFLVGRWNVANRRLEQRLAGSDNWTEFPATAEIRSLFDGAANIDEITFSDGTKGLTLRLYDLVTEEWSLYWAISNTGRLYPPVIGTFHDGRGEFYGDDTSDGQPVRVRFIWSEITANSARWEQAFSADAGKTWETNWIMTLTRA
jgi:hypothetical protein